MACQVYAWGCPRAGKRLTLQGRLPVSTQLAYDAQRRLHEATILATIPEQGGLRSAEKNFGRILTDRMSSQIRHETHEFGFLLQTFRLVSTYRRPLSPSSSCPPGPPLRPRPRPEKRNRITSFPHAIILLLECRIYRQIPNTCMRKRVHRKLGIVVIIAACKQRQLTG